MFLQGGLFANNSLTLPAASCAHNNNRPSLHMAAYTLAQAAQACGVNRSTVLRAIKSGKVSGHRDANGAWQIEPSELHRIYPVAEVRSDAAPQHAQADAELKVRAELAELRLADLKIALDEAREDMKRWREIAERLSLVAPKPIEQPQTLWRWLRSRAD
jgi:hypothetical protein